MADFDMKEEDIEIKEEAVEVKHEDPETEESGSTARQGEKRVLSPSHSPETKKQRTEVEQVWIKEEAYEKGVSQESPIAIKMTTSFSWSTQATFTLLEKVRDREELWNAKHLGYNKKTLRRGRVEEITKELKAEFPSLPELTTEDVIVRLIYLRGHFQKLLRKLEKTPSGSGGKVTPKWEYFEACSFLTPVYSNTTSASSVQPTSNTSEIIYEGTAEDLLDALGNAELCFHGNSSASSASSTPLPSQTPSVRLQSGKTHKAKEHPHEEEDTPTLLSSSSTPSVLPAPAVAASASATQPLASTSKLTPQSHRKQKCRDNPEMVEETLVKTLKCVQEMMKAQERKQTVQYDLATQTVMSFIRLIPDSHQQVKYEFTERLLSLVVEYMQKINTKIHNGV
ncbi:hypothetical protein GWK47_034061 [Chionoecetes opilio]|uniref:MADF domain-containing protein n=1 Tax=Chionoecetes opilio TaxID=41210 RepID=A0A8J4YV21_CHIOP|nr:hypothetical protein GWK47_034061 [Chionoecetes opilio]